MAPFRPRSATPIGVALLLLAAAVGLGIVKARAFPPEEESERLLYLPSPGALKHLALSLDDVMADVYWMRTIQHFGGDRLSTRRSGRFELLWPLLDITTTLDPHFTIAYRYGAIFLSQPPPGGPGRPDLALKLLEKGIAADPKWQYYHDAGFVCYWYQRDYGRASQWFERASTRPNAPIWIRGLAATTLQHGGQLEGARLLWQQVLSEVQYDWVRSLAERSLAQIDAVEQMQTLQRVVDAWRRTAPTAVPTWGALVRARLLGGVPIDPSGTPYDLDPATGRVVLSPGSPLAPLPRAQVLGSGS